MENVQEIVLVAEHVQLRSLVVKYNDVATNYFFVDTADSALYFLLQLGHILDGVQCVYAIYEDFKCGTSRNTIEKVSFLLLRRLGLNIGSAVDAAVGHLAIPDGIGEMMGYVVGGYLGSKCGRKSSKYVVKIADALNYETKQCECIKCKRVYKRHLHKSEESNVCCPKCCLC